VKKEGDLQKLKRAKAGYDGQVQHKNSAGWGRKKAPTFGKNDEKRLHQKKTASPEKSRENTPTQQKRKNARKPSRARAKKVSADRRINEAAKEGGTANRKNAESNKKPQNLTGTVPNRRLWDLPKTPEKPIRGESGRKRKKNSIGDY